MGEFTVSAGERVALELIWHPTHEPEPPARDPEQALRETHAWWHEWSGRCGYDGEWREARSRTLA